MLTIEAEFISLARGACEKNCSMMHVDELMWSMDEERFIRKIYSDNLGAISLGSGAGFIISTLPREC